MIAEAEAKITRRLFTVEEYHQMAEAGILRENDRIELIHGEIIQMSLIGKDHSAIVRRLIALLTSRIPSDTILDAQNPILIDDHSEPEPDIVILPF